MVFELIGSCSANAHIRLDDDRVSDLFDKRFHVFKRVDHDVPSDRNAGLAVELFHVALALEAFHLIRLQAGRNVEIGAQAGILLEPVFIVGLEPVDLAVAERKVRDTAVDRIVVFQRIDFIVFSQRRFQVRMEIIKRRVADAEHVDSVLLQPNDKKAEDRREIGGNENKIHGIDTSFEIADKQVIV